MIVDFLMFLTFLVLCFLSGRTWTHRFKKDFVNIKTSHCIYVILVHGGKKDKKNILTLSCILLNLGIFLGLVSLIIELLFVVSNLHHILDIEKYLFASKSYLIPMYSILIASIYSIICEIFIEKPFSKQVRDRKKAKKKLNKVLQTAHFFGTTSIQIKDYILTGEHKLLPPEDRDYLKSGEEVTEENLLITGYLADGQIDKAVKIFEDLDLNEKDKPDYIIKSNFLFDFCATYFLLGDIESATFYYEKLEALISISKTSEDNITAKCEKIFHKGMYVMECLLKNKEVEYKNVLKLLKRNISYSLETKLLISVVYERIGDMKKQKKLLKYIVKHGHKSYVAEIARKTLKVLDD